MPQLCKYFCIKIQIKILSRIDYSLSLWVVLGVAKSRTQLSYWTTTKWKKFCLFFFPASLIIGTSTQTFRTTVICGEMSITCLSSIYAINIGILKLYTQFQWKVTKEAWKDILTAQCVCVCVGDGGWWENICMSGTWRIMKWWSQEWEQCISGEEDRSQQLRNLDRAECWCHGSAWKMEEVKKRATDHTLL